MDERMCTTDTQLYQTQRIVLFDAGNTHYPNISTVENSTGAQRQMHRRYDDVGHSTGGLNRFIHGIYNTTQGDYAFYDEDGENFALTFTSTLNESFTTYPIYLHNDPQRLSKQIELALKSLPNRVITDVEVNTKMNWIRRNVNDTYFKKRSYDGENYDGEIDIWGALNNPTHWKTTDQRLFHYIEMNITFNGVPKGPQNLITIEAKECKDGCTPKLNGVHLLPFGPGNGGFIVEAVKADFNNYECGRRGKCDYETGECECFEGYTGEACSTQTALV